MLEQKDFIPARLKNVVRVLSDVDYATYYDEIHNSGLVIPAFKGSDYYGGPKKSYLLHQIRVAPTDARLGHVTS